MGWEGGNNVSWTYGNKCDDNVHSTWKHGRCYGFGGWGWGGEQERVLSFQSRSMLRHWYVGLMGDDHILGRRVIGFHDFANVHGTTALMDWGGGPNRPESFWISWWPHDTRTKPGWFPGCGHSSERGNRDGQLGGECDKHRIKCHGCDARNHRETQKELEAHFKNWIYWVLTHVVCGMTSRAAQKKHVNNYFRKFVCGIDVNTALLKVEKILKLVLQ